MDLNDEFLITVQLTNNLDGEIIFRFDGLYVIARKELDIVYLGSPNGNMIDTKINVTLLYSETLFHLYHYIIYIYYANIGFYFYQNNRKRHDIIHERLADYNLQHCILRRLNFTPNRALREYVLTPTNLIAGADRNLLRRERTERQNFK